MPDPSTSPPPQVKPTTAQVLTTLIGGLVLAGGSCAGFLTTLNLNRGDNPLNIALALGFFVGLLVAFAGVVLGIVRLVRVARRRRAGDTIAGPGSG